MYVYLLYVLFHITYFIMTIQQEDVYVRALYKGYKEFGLKPDRDTQGYAKIHDDRLHASILQYSYQFGASPDFSLDEIGRIRNPLYLVQTLISAYRHGMKFDYDAQNFRAMDDATYTSLIVNAYSMRILDPDYDLHHLERIPDGYYRFVILAHVYGDGLSTMHSTECRDSSVDIDLLRQRYSGVSS